jgi:serine/threonine protein kinase/tetratricopeptide (TPR) repeat protein
MANTCPKCNFKNTSDSKFCKECGTQLPGIEEIEVTETLETPKEELTTGSTFAGRYQIIEELGKGGMGKVYKVHDTKIKEKIALKLIKPEIAKDKKTLERFSNELKFARKIRHKNICQMFDLGEDRGTHFITMEFVEGQDLKKLIRQSGQLAIGTTINMAKQVCDGLVEAHSSGVVHRDLKPSNIMIDADGNARIMDFGIARSIEGKGITGAGVMIGTPEYMSPEQVEGKEVDQRSDIYSLGVILYEMATGRVPFEGDTPFTVGVKHKSEFPQNPKEINTQIPDDLNNVILKCLEKDKEKRYQKAGEVRSELESIEKGIPTTERIVPERKPLTSREITVQFSLKKLLIPVMVIMALVIVGLILWSPWSKKAAAPASSDKHSLAVLFFRNGSGDPSLDIWKENLCDYIITDLSQSKYIRVFDFTQIVGSLEKHNLLGVNRYSDEHLRSVCSSLGASYILTGSFSTPGESFRIDYSLYDFKKGDGISSDRVEGVGVESVQSLVDELTKKIKADFNLTDEEILADFDREVGTITTLNPEAYRCYREGRKLYVRGDQMESIPLMEKAIKLDPNFAMAYRSIGIAYQNNYYYDQGDEYIKKAFELIDKVSYKEQLYIKSNYYYYVEEDEEKSIEVLKKILEEYPEDTFANATIGVNYLDYEDWDLVIKHFEICVKNKGEFSGIYHHLGTAYEAKGMYEKAREAFRSYIDYFGESVGFQQRLADNYVYDGKYDQAIVEADKALAMNPNGYGKGGIYHLQGDFKAAEEAYRSQLESDLLSVKMNGWRWLEFLYKMMGQFEKAKKKALAGLEYAEDINHRNWQRIFNALLAWYDLTNRNLNGVLEKADFIFDSAEEDNLPVWQENSLWWKIKVHLRKGNIEEALVLAEEVKKCTKSTVYLYDDKWYLDDLGLIEMKKRNYSKAIDLFTQVYEMQGSQRSWLDPHAYILYNLASAYYLNGDLEAAQREYENILTLTTGRLSNGDLYVKSYYQLGKICEQKGDTAKAIENYEKFLDLWKDADPGIAEVEDARKRLAGLK